MRSIAIILAAGMGTRLRPETNVVPKCLVKANGKPILEYQLEMLKNAGTNKIYIVGGYLVEELRSYILNSRFSEFSEIVINKDYQSTNNMYSLKIALDRVFKENWDVLYVLNGDVVFEKDFLAGEESKLESGIFIDRSLYVDEAMKITVDNEGVITNISKKIPEIDAYAVSVDMYRFSKNDADIFYSKINEIIGSERINQWTEVALSELFHERGLLMKPIDRTGYIWWEIDNNKDKIRSMYRIKLANDVDTIRNLKVFAFDLDGTVNLGKKPIQGAKEFVEFLRSRKKQIAFITNNSSLSKKEHCERISSILEIQVADHEVFSSVDHIKSYLNKKKYKNVFPLVNERVVKELGIKGSSTAESDVVLVGFHTETTYEKLSKACILVQKGADFVLIHPDKRCPTDEGFIPDAGSLGDLIRTVSGKQPNYVGGKPNPDMLIEVAQRFFVDLEEVAYFGDRIYTDIKMVEKLPAKAFLMLTGETSFEEFAKQPQYSKDIDSNNVFIGENFIFLRHFLMKRSEIDA